MNSELSNNKNSFKEREADSNCRKVIRYILYIHNITISDVSTGDEILWESVSIPSENDSNIFKQVFRYLKVKFEFKIKFGNNLGV